MSGPSRARRALPLLLVLYALLAGCTNERRVEDAVDTRCKDDPSCRGQKCVDARAELWAKGDYKAATMLDCSAGGL